MSEYQYYEFLAIDRPLDHTEREDVRSLSTRATITATRFVNEYHWGGFRGDPLRLMGRYYDAHLYVANWGTHRVMFRLPRDLLNPDVVDECCVGDQVKAWVIDGFVVLGFTSEADAGEYDIDDDPESLLSALVGVRAELAEGDLRPLYLAWLAAYGSWEREGIVFDRDDGDDLEPSVPPGLGALSGAQRALADFLRLDDDLIAAAAQASARLGENAEDLDDLAAWVDRLPAAEKNQLLERVVRGESGRVSMELRRRFRDEAVTIVADSGRRTVADLLDEAARLRAERDRRLAVHRAEHTARQERARRLAQERRLDVLAAEGDAVWSRVEAMLATRKPTEYDAAVTLLAELGALAEREGRKDTYTSRTIALRDAHSRKPSLIERLNRAGI